MRALLFLTLMVAANAPSAAAAEPESFVFFNVERHRIREASFLKTKALVGAQLKYTWRELEPEKDEYRLQPILEDYHFLKKHGKKLFIQIQDVSFSRDIVNVPDYLREDPAYGGGVELVHDVDGDDPTKATPEGWVARRWDPDVRERFLRLLRKLGQALDGKIEGLNLPETSTGFGAIRFYPEDFSHDGYEKAVIAIMSGARSAFQKSHVIQYANFMPGEWLPFENNGHLERVYAHATEIGIGVGGPDLLPFRKGQLNHSYPLISARKPGTIAGVAVQWGNFDDINPATGERTTVDEIYSFGRDVLRLDYIFWGTQEPYYSEEIIPHLRSLARTAER